MSVQLYILTYMPTTLKLFNYNIRVDTDFIINYLLFLIKNTLQYLHTNTKYLMYFNNYTFRLINYK